MGIFDKLFGKRKKQEPGMSLLEIGSGKSVGTVMWTSKPTKIKSEEQAQPIISQILKETLEEEVDVPEIRKVKTLFFLEDGSFMITFSGDDIPRDKVLEITARLDEKIRKYQ